MPSIKYNSKAEPLVFELLPEGDYCFEIVGFDLGISTGGKTKGDDQMELKVAIFKDATFTKKLAQWTENFQFSKSVEWKIELFAKCSGITIGGRIPNDGEEIEFTEDTVLGLRGHCTVHQNEYTPAGSSEKKKNNRVSVWITNKGTIPRNTPAPKVEGEKEVLPF